MTIQRVYSSYTYGMRNVLVAVAATALVAMIANTEAPHAQAPKPPVTPAVSHASTRQGAAKKPAPSARAAVQADQALEAQNQLVAGF